MTFSNLILMAFPFWHATSYPWTCKHAKQAFTIPIWGNLVREKPRQVAGCIFMHVSNVCHPWSGDSADRNGSVTYALLSWV